MNQLLNLSEAYIQAISLKNFLATNQSYLDSRIFVAEGNSLRLSKLLDFFIDGVEASFERALLLEVE